MKTKQNKKKSREFTHQLYYKNRINFIVTIILTIAMSSINLMISWLIQQIMDSMANQKYAVCCAMCMDCSECCYCLYSIECSLSSSISKIFTTGHAAVPRLCVFAADTEKFALFFKGRNRTLRFRVDK